MSSGLPCGAWAEGDRTRSLVCPPFQFERLADPPFRHQNGASPDPKEVKHLPETMGAGVAFFDYDGDGDQDLYLVQSGELSRAERELGDHLYRNLGEGRFELDPRALAGLPGGYGQGVLAFDRDGDADLDLLLTRFGQTVLLDNDGSGRFEMAAPGALPQLDHPWPWGSSAAAADLDGDGDLDLYITGYLDYDLDEPLFCGDAESGIREHCDPSLFRGQADRPLENLGDGTFRRISPMLQPEPGEDIEPGKGLGVLFVDLDQDRRPDLYVANDLTPNALLRNLGAGRFEDLSLASGAGVDRNGRPEAGMGVAVLDADHDGDPDLAVTNFDVETNTLYQNSGELFFRDVAAQSGFGLPSFNQLGFGLLARDFDLDGDVDFFVANGHIFEQPKRGNVSYRQANQLLEGLSASGGPPGRFRAVECDALEAEARVSRGAASADWDLDGDIDLAVNNNDDAPSLLENRALENRALEDGGREWLGVTLVGRPPNTEAIGSVVTLSGAEMQRRWVIAGDSYQSSSSRSLRFGFASGEDPTLEVIWPDGTITRVEGPVAGRSLRIVQR